MKNWNWKKKKLYRQTSYLYSFSQLNIVYNDFSQVFTNPEINSIALDRQESSTNLYAGCGDNNVYVWDIDTGELTVSILKLYLW